MSGVRYKKFLYVKARRFYELQEHKMIIRAESEPHHFLIDNNYVHSSCPIPLETWATHFESILSRRDLHADPPQHEWLEITPTNMYLNRVIDAYEVASCISSMKDHKAPGPDGLTYEHLKLSSDVLIPYWTRLFNLCLSSMKIPEVWRHSTMTVIYKNKGSLLDPDAFRGICKQACGFKLFCKLLAKRLYQHCEQLVPPEQYGFMKYRSTIHAVQSLLSYVQDSIYEHRAPVYAVFIDYKKAFDSIDRQAVIETLYDLNVSGPVLGLTYELLRFNLISVFDGTQCTQPIMQNLGVPQGDSLSPLLFVLVTIGIINSVKESFPTVRIIMYADDAVVCSPCLAAVQSAFDLLVNLSKRFNLTVNSAKTKWMKFRRGGRVAAQEEITLGQARIERSSYFTYLGITVTPTARSFTLHVRERTRKALLCAMKTLRNPRVLSVDTAIKLFMLKIAPIACYGISVIWSYLSLKNLAELDKVLSSYLKRVLGVSTCTRNRLVYQMAGCSTFVEYIKSKFSLPVTSAYESFIAELEEKYATIDHKFYSTPVMLNLEWRTCMYDKRHILTRHGAHGFHYIICCKTGYHEVDEYCTCKFCSQLCDQYHFLECTYNPMSLTDAAMLPA